MKCTCKQRDLLNALNVAVKAINNGNTLPVLNNFLIKAESEKLIISATNLEIAITMSINAVINEAGSITIPAKLLNSYVNYLKENEIEISSDDHGQSLNLKSDGATTNIKGISAEEFPAIPKIEKETSFFINSEVLGKAIQQVVFATSLNKSRPILTGVYFEMHENEVKIVATDSYRLSEKTIKLKKSVEKDFQCIIPSRTILELGKIISGKNEDIQVVISQNQVLFKIDKIELISRLIEGKFPDYKQIIPEAPKTKAIIELSDLVLALKRVNLFAKENSNNIKLEFRENNMLSLTTQATQFGSGEEVLETNISGIDNEIALNSEFMLDVFSTISDHEVSIEIDTSLSPVIIKVPKIDNFLHIIMPLKL